MNLSMKRPDVCFRRGAINLSKSVVSKLQLRDGDVISIMEDTRLNEVYIYVQCRREDVTGRYSGVCRKTKSNSSHLRAYSSTLYKFISDKLGEGNIDLIVGELTSVDIIGDALPLIMKNIYDRRSKI